MWKRHDGDKMTPGDMVTTVDVYDDGEKAGGVDDGTSGGTVGGEGRSELISGEFYSQHITNTLWEFPTMGRKPGERMMGHLEGRSGGGPVGGDIRGI